MHTTVNKRFFPVFRICLFVLCMCHPANYTCFSQTSQPLSRLADAIRRELRSPALRKVIAAVEISLPANDSILFSHNAQLLLRPASNAKLFVTAASLLQEGGMPKFTTLIKRAGPDTAADIWMVGDGNPVLSMRDIDTMVHMIIRSGIRRISALHIDASLIDSLHFGKGWMWDDETDATTPFLCAFPIERGRCTISAHAAGGPGDPVSVAVFPDSKHMKVRNRARAGNMDKLSVRRLPGSNTFEVNGSLRPGSHYEERFSMWNPDIVFADLLLRSLADAGLADENTSVSFDTSPDNRSVSVASIDADDERILSAICKDSDNMCAEMLLKRIGAQHGLTGSSEEGINWMLRVLGKNGIDTADILMVDGSGLSYYNLTTAHALGEVLRTMARSAQRDRFISALAVGGRDGTLKNRFGNMAHLGVIHAKTGTLRSVVSLSGYVDCSGRDLLAFVILIQNTPADHGAYRLVQERILHACMEYLSSRPTQSR
jgi:PBP4 family serine-type D-alanyl-D-alanine carboxypeptidase